MTVHGGFSQDNRAPSPIELGCSDPANPCVLPNALQADPPLKQVVSRTVAQLAAHSGAYVRGNENNAHAADGVAFFGSGRLQAYTVLHLTGEWKFARDWELFGRINNVFDKRYATGGLLAANAFDATGAVQPPANCRNEQFNTPAAPRSAWTGVRWHFGAK